MDINHFIPKNKFDTALIEQLENYKYPFYKPILKDLFKWIQDLNWPVAQKIIPLLIKARKDIIPIVKEILNSNDDIWKYWTLSQVISKMDTSIIKELKNELMRIVNNPTNGEELEEVNIISETLLNKL